MKEQIKQFIKNSSYFDFEDYDEECDELHYSARENGDVGEEEYSPIDYKEAIRIKNHIISNYPGTEVSVDTCDEWVDIRIILPKNE